MQSTMWWTCTRCETQLRAGMRYCWECGEAVPPHAAPGDPRRGETGALLVYVPERQKRGEVELYRNWEGSDPKPVASAIVAQTYGTVAFDIASGCVAVIAGIPHGNYTVVEVPERDDEVTNATPVTIVDGELTEVDWR